MNDYSEPLWVPLEVDGGLVLTVTADYVLDAQGIRAALKPVEAQALADRNEAMLPTPKIVRAIEAVATHVKFTAFKPRDGEDRGSARLVRESHDACERAIKAAPNVSLLFAGHKKDIVVGRTRTTHPQKVAIYGGLYVNNARVQPLFPPVDSKPTVGHSLGYFDYSHGTRLVKLACTFKGAPYSLVDVFANPKLANIVSGTGSLTREALRYPAP